MPFLTKKTLVRTELATVLAVFRSPAPMMLIRCFDQFNVAYCVCFAVIADFVADTHHHPCVTLKAKPTIKAEHEKPKPKQMPRQNHSRIQKPSNFPLNHADANLNSANNAEPTTMQNMKSLGVIALPQHCKSDKALSEIRDHICHI